MDNLGEGLIYYVVFLFSTTVHEAAHAWQAKRGGDLTAYHGGQVSLDTGGRAVNPFDMRAQAAPRGTWMDWQRKPRV